MRDLLLSGKLWIGAHVLAAIEAEARVHRLRETGGALFGYYSVDGEVVVTRASGPGPKARHARFRFVADREHTQELIDRAFKETDGGETYLGAWHTHPLGRARPSSHDVDTLRGFAEQPSLCLPSPVALIQQTRPLRRRVGIGELGAFQWNSEVRRVDRLDIYVARLGE